MTADPVVDVNVTKDDYAAQTLLVQLIQVLCLDNPTWMVLSALSEVTAKVIAQTSERVEDDETATTLMDRSVRQWLRAYRITAEARR